MDLLCIEINNEERPQCTICLKALGAESIPPSIKRLFETLHLTLVGTPTEFFKKKLSRM